MKTYIHFLLKRIEWYNSWLVAMKLLSVLFPSAKARTECTGHVCSLQWANGGFGGESTQHTQRRPGWGSGQQSWVALSQSSIVKSTSSAIPLSRWCWNCSAAAGHQVVSVHKDLACEQARLSWIHGALSSRDHRELVLRLKSMWHGRALAVLSRETVVSPSEHHWERKNSTKGLLFLFFFLLKEYFLYLLAFECGLRFNHRNEYFPNCLPFVEQFPLLIPPL